MTLNLQYSFAQKTSLIFTNLNSFDIENDMIRQATQSKTFLTLHNFQQTRLCFMSEKHFLTAKNYIHEALGKKMSVYLCISL